MLKSVVDSLMIFVSTIGNVGLVWLVLASILLLNRSWRQAGWLVLLSFLVSAAAQSVLKDLFKRPRPAVDPTTLLIDLPTSYSFPSGHTLIAFSVATTLCLLMPRLGAATALLACLIGLSRVYLGVHYHTDVIFGALMGVVLGGGIILLNKWTQQWRASSKQGLPLDTDTNA